MIIFDVNNNDSQSPLRCPHPAFLDNAVLDNAKRLLSSPSGLFVLNFASRDDTSHDRADCVSRLSANFAHLAAIKVDDDINEVMFASEGSALNVQRTSKLSTPNLSIDFDLEELFSKVKIEK